MLVEMGLFKVQTVNMHKGMFMENQVEAQVDLIHANPLANQQIGDDPIYWDSCMGDPAAVANATFDGINFTAYYSNVNEGVYLTESIDSTSGYMYWNKSFDYKKDIIFEGTFAAGGGEGGADGIVIYFGATDQKTIQDTESNGIAVFFDEYNGNIIKVYKDGNQQDIDFNSTVVLDDSRWRNYTVVYEYVDDSNAYVTVLIENVFMCRVNVGSWVSTAGNYVGASAWCGGQSNDHLCKSFRVKSATPWLTMNRK